MPRSHRLTRGAELQATAREGKRIRTRHLDVRVLASPLGHPRVGFVVPKSGHSSVERNRLKRRLRELSRTRLLPGAPPVDIVIRTRRDTYAVPFEALERDVVRVEQELRRRFAGAAATPAATPAVPPLVPRAEDES